MRQKCCTIAVKFQLKRLLGKEYLLKTESLTHWPNNQILLIDLPIITLEIAEIENKEFIIIFMLNGTFNKAFKKG